MKFVSNYGRLSARQSSRARNFVLRAFAAALVPLCAHASVSSVSIADSSVLQPASGTANMDFTLSRSGDTSYAVAVPYATADGSAVAGTDYTATSGSLVIPAGSTTATVSVPVLGGSNTADKSFFLNLSSATGVGATADFARAGSFNAGTNPESTVVGDFNGDGKPDLATANQGSDNVSVLLNTTAPGAASTSYATAVDFAVGSNPVSIAAGDFNGDGKLDLAIANQNSNTVSVLFNTTAPGAATASYSAAVSFAVGNTPAAVAIGDFNRDGKPDLAVANQGSNNVSVLLNTSAPGAVTPSYAAAVNFSAGGSRSVAVGDFNGDGKPDLALANFGSTTVSVLLNTTAPGAAAPSYAAAANFAVGSNPKFVAVGDFNGDGKPDLAAANYNSDTVSVLLNGTAPGSSTLIFRAAANFAVGGAPSAIALGDFNGDGKTDLVVGNEGGNTVSILLNTTAPGAAIPSYTAAVSLAPFGAVQSLAVGDFNGDGKTDLVISNSDILFVLLNTTAPSTAALALGSAASFSVGTNPEAVAVGDFNGDGKPDLAVPNSTPNSVSILLNKTLPGAATPSYAAAVNFAVGGSPDSVAVGDFNCDGKPDLAVVNTTGGNVSVLLNTTTSGAAVPSYAAPVNFAVGGNPLSIAVGDFNGDGRLDLAVGNGTTSNIAILFNTTAPGGATPAYAAAVNITAGDRPVSVAVGDFNGDGKPDLASANINDNNTSILINTTAPGAATPSYAAAVNFVVGIGPHSIAVGDFNGDGRPDLIAANTDSSNGVSSSTVSVLFNTTAPGAATPSYAAAVNFGVGTNPISVAVGDVDGDGKPDLAVANLNSGNVSILLNRTAPGAAAPSYAIALTFGAGSGPSAIALGDFNGDGKPDLVVADFSGDDVSVLLNAQLQSGLSDIFAQGTIVARDTTPNAFSFTPATGVNPSSVQTSNAITVSGINTAAPISVAGGSYSIGCTATFVSSAGTINNGQTACVRQTASSTFSTTTTATLTIGGVNGGYAVTTVAADTMPSAFSFTPAIGVNPSSVQTSNAITVSGINTAAPISVAGGSYSIGCTATFVSSAGTINNGQTVCVRQTASSNFSAATTAALNIGGVAADYKVTTRTADMTPDAFSFTPATGVAPSSVQTSNSITVSGVEAPAPISVSGGSYSIGCTATFVTSAGTISNGQTVCVRQTASSSFSTTTTATLTIGGVNGGYAVTTVAADTAPNAFSFTPATGVNPNSVQTSNAVTVSGINTAAPISVNGGSYSIGCTATFVSSAGTINNGQTACVRQTASSSFSTATTATLTIGGVNGGYAVTTVAADTAPNALSFTPVTGVMPGSVQTSNTATISGINTAAPISVSGGSYSVGCTATFVTSAGSISNGQTVCVRQTASSSFSTTTMATLTVGGVSSSFDVTTAAEPPPDQSGSGGGGAIGFWLMLPLAGAGLWRRRSRSPTQRSAARMGHG